MSEIITGGPAFPIECHIAGGYRADEGLTMRDYFAAQALMGLLAADKDAEFKPAGAAESAYGMADAMLAHKYATDPKPSRDDDDRPF